MFSFAMEPKVFQGCWVIRDGFVEANAWVTNIQMAQSSLAGRSTCLRCPECDHLDSGSTGRGEELWALEATATGGSGVQVVTLRTTETGGATC
jgi:hypothetical protein